MSSSPEAIALAYLDAVAKKDLARVESLLDPELRFVSPASTLTNARDFLAALRRIAAIHVRNDVVRVFSEGNDVCVIYDFVTDTVGSVPTVEWLRVEGGKIRAVNLYYDQVPWMKLREELARRAAKASA